MHIGQQMSALCHFVGSTKHALRALLDLSETELTASVLKKETNHTRLHVLSCSVLLKSVLLISCVFCALLSYHTRIFDINGKIHF